MVSLRPFSDSKTTPAPTAICLPLRSLDPGEPVGQVARQQPGEISATQSWRELAVGIETEVNGTVLSRLSPAERVVVAYLCQGLSNKEIARTLGKSEFTVKHQVSACLTKLGVSSRTRLIAMLR